MGTRVCDKHIDATRDPSNEIACAFAQRVHRGLHNLADRLCKQLLRVDSPRRKKWGEAPVYSLREDRREPADRRHGLPLNSVLPFLVGQSRQAGRQQLLVVRNHTGVRARS